MEVFASNNIKFNRLTDLEDDNFEVLWVHTRPSRLPRSFHCLVVATVYHPPSSNNKDMLQYLTRSVSEVEGRFPGCGIIIAGDFNNLNIKYFCGV
jgi:hypothetical protein